MKEDAVSHTPSSNQRFRESSIFSRRDLAKLDAVGPIGPAFASYIAPQLAAATQESSGTLNAGTEVKTTVNIEDRNGSSGIEVSTGVFSGWIPLDAIDPATLPPEGEIEYVYVYVP